MTEMYGEANVEFIKVDGNKVYDVARKYSVQSFPTFIYVQPKSNGLKAVVFKGNRSYQTMKSWMQKLMADVPVKNAVPEDYEEEELNVASERYAPTPKIASAGDSKLMQEMAEMLYAATQKIDALISE